MSRTIVTEMETFFFFAAHGLTLLLVYDFLRGWRVAVPHGPVWRTAEDILFCFTAALWTFLVIFLYQDGVLRLYSMAAMALGMFFYLKILSKWVIRGISTILRLILYIISFFIKKNDDFWKKTVAKFVGKD